MTTGKNTYQRHDVAAGFACRVRCSVATLGILLVLTLLSACRHRDFYYDDGLPVLGLHTYIVADYDRYWELPPAGATDWRTAWPAAMPFDYNSLVPGVPTGLRVIDYPDATTSYMHNIDATGGEVPLAAGRHGLLFCNNDVEYIDWNGLDAYATAYATTRTRTRSTYHGNTLYRSSRADGRQERTLSPPDVLYACYVPSYERSAAQTDDTLRVTLRPAVCTYVLRFVIDDGLARVALARGALAGMAAGTWLAEGRNSSEAATLLYDCQLTPWGAVATVCTFGVPDWPAQRYVQTAGLFAATLEIATKKGDIVSYDFDITSQIISQPRGGVVTISGITVPEESTPPVPPAQGSAFLVDVNGWGPFEDVETTTW